MTALLSDITTVIWALTGLDIFIYLIAAAALIGVIGLVKFIMKGW